MVRRDWKNKTVEELIDYRNEHYLGMDRSEVKKVDSGFYAAVQKRKLQDQVFSESKHKDWTKFEVEDFQNYYQTNYAGLSRGEVNKADSGFYGVVLRRELQDQVFPEGKKKKNGYWKNKTVEELICYYNENYLGMSRSEVQKANGSFYGIILSRELQDQVFPESKTKNNRSWKNKTVEDLIDYYQTNYTGMGRKEVEKADSGFHSAVQKRKLQNQVFPESKHKDWTKFEVEDFQNYYQTNHLGKSRYEVSKADPGFYSTVCNKKLQDQVFPESSQSHYRDWSGFELEELIDYYQTNHLGKSRYEVQKVDRAFYFQVCKRELQDQVFPESSQSHYRDWSKFEVENFQEYYQTNYADMSRTEVQKVDKGFYLAVMKRELLDQVFPESKYKNHKPKDYWKDIDNVKKPLEELIDELGHFPSKYEIRNTNMSLYSAIRTYHNGYISVKNQMGYFEREKELARILLELF